ncbi:hypothetical protein Vadar_017134 [Vaccinium darrowii]|uniref:Uncharacterized protein n=1 Tax=Vaccinium darrowii TaxID=229202 RepID=A0ACB7YEA0_9ERIC|nr:hypothetical protein Vadar_017134 [Vaccinium darrowii]
MDSDKANPSKSNLPSGPFSPKRQKVEKVDQTVNNGQQIPIPISNPPNGSNAPSQVPLGAKPMSPVNYVHQKQLLQRLLQQQRQQQQRLTNGVPMAPKVEKVDQTVDNGQQTLITISNPPNMSNALSQILPGSGAMPLSPVNYVHQKQHLQRLLQHQRQQQMLTIGAPMALVEKVDQTVDNGRQIPIPMSNPPKGSNAPSQVLPGSGANLMSPVNYVNQKQLQRLLQQQQQLRFTNGAPMAPVEKVDQTVDNGRQTPIPISNPPNGRNALSQVLPGSKANPVSPAKYVHEKQLLRQPLLQHQRLTNGVPMAPKWSTKEISKALVTEDNIAPIAVDPMHSQAGQGHAFSSMSCASYIGLSKEMIWSPSIQSDLPMTGDESMFGIVIPCSMLPSQVVEGANSKASTSTISPRAAAPIEETILQQVVEGANSKASTSTISPRAAAPVEDILSGILDGRGILITLGDFPYYLCDRTKHALVASFFLHMKHKEYVRCNSELLDAGRLRILFSGPTGSRIYQKKLAMALAHHFGAKLLVLGNSFFPADLYTMGIGPSHDVLWTHFRQRATQSSSYPSQSDMNHHSFKEGDRVIFVGSNFGGVCSTNSPRGPTFGSLGEIVLLAQVSYVSKLGVRFDKPIHGGLDLGGKCEAGYGFHCNASELCLDPTTLKDFNKSITNHYLEAITCASRDSPLILFMKDVDKFVQENSEAYLVIKYLISKLPENVFVIGSQRYTENKKEKESYSSKFEKDKKLPETTKLLSNLFPNKISIEMPEDEKQIALLKDQFSKDSELIIAEENIICLRNVLIQSGLDCKELEELSMLHQTLTYESAEKVIRWALGYQLMEYPPSNASPNLVLSLKSIEYGVNVLREIQPKPKTSEKLLKDVVTENGLEKILLHEVIPPSETGVKFDDIGALENVKDTLKELVMLPLQRPELFCKGRLRKPCKGILLFGPPGTGKTMLAKAIATEAGANFINISASTIASKWYGDAEKYVRAVFSLAIKITPSIIFIDEVDSLLGRRGNNEHEVTRRIKNEFMMKWDGLLTKDGEQVLVLAATNRPFDLDEAVIRRMPRRFMVNLPDTPNRTKILRVILEKEELSPDVDFDAISGMTEGYSGSDLKNLCVTAAYCPVREMLQSEKQENAVTVPDMEPMPALKKTSEIRPISMEDFKYAREQISASFSSSSMNMNELLQWNELYGEGGSRKGKETTLSYFL